MKIVHPTGHIDNAGHLAIDKIELADGQVLTASEANALWNFHGEEFFIESNGELLPITFGTDWVPVVRMCCHGLATR